MVVSSQRLKHCYDADIKVEAPLPESKEDGMQYNQLRGISNRMYIQPHDVHISIREWSAQKLELIISGSLVLVAEISAIPD